MQKKYYLLGIIVVILIALAIIYYFNYSKVSVEPVSNNPQLITEVKVNRTAEELKVYQQKIDELLALIAKNDKGNYYSLANVHVVLGQQYEAIGKLELARQQYLQAIQLDELNSYNTYSLLGLLYHRMHDDQQALQAFEKSVNTSIGSSFETLWTTYLNFHIDTIKSKSEVILPIFVKALKATQNDPNILLLRAQYYVSIGSYQEALNDYDLILKAYPNNEDIKGARAEVEAKLKQK